MLRILKWLFAVLLLVGVVLLAVQFVLANTEPMLRPQFVLVWGSRYAWHLSEPWPAGLLMLSTFMGGIVGGLILAAAAAAGMEMRIMRYRREIKNLRREVESLRVSDLDEDLEREMSPDEDDDDPLGTRVSRPVTSGAVSTFPDDSDTSADYDSLVTGSDSDSDETRRGLDSDASVWVGRFSGFC